MKTPLPEEYVNLQPLNTLRLPAIARYFAKVRSPDQVPYWLAWAEETGLPVLVLGGGSNLVLASDFPGLVISISLHGRAWRYINEQEAELTVAAGEPWHDLVMYTAELGFRGLENLALIPGRAGAAPVQNIGAYGAELADVLVSVDAYDRQEKKWCRLEREACRFGYRDSLFKQQPDRYLITGLTVHLSKQRPLRVDYRDLAQWFEHRSLDTATATANDVANAVMAIRRNKLPDPDALPNAGSFFKNPVVETSLFEQLKARFPDIVSYPDARGVKLAAGWLIDQCGWKGYRNNVVGVHSRQALVLVNLGEGTGADIMGLADAIAADVRETFGVELEVEPRVVHFDVC